MGVRGIFFVGTGEIDGNQHMDPRHIWTSAYRAMPYFDIEYVCKVLVTMAYYHSIFLMMDNQVEYQRTLVRWIK